MAVVGTRFRSSWLADMDNGLLWRRVQFGDLQNASSAPFRRFLFGDDTLSAQSIARPISAQRADLHQIRKLLAAAYGFSLSGGAVVADPIGAYSIDHASAYAAVAEAGDVVTFSLVNKRYTPSLDRYTTVATSVVSGVAIQVGNDATRFEVETLIEQRPITLLFVATQYGDVPEVGSTVAWQGDSYTVKDVVSLAPDGVAITSRVAMVR